MPLDPIALETPGTPEYWMQYLSSLLLDRYRTLRLGKLAAYRAGCPPITFLTGSDRKGFYQFLTTSRTNFARKVVRSKTNRMRVRAIRTSVATDDRGDEVAWSYWKRSGLYAASKLVHEDEATFNEGYVRVSVTEDGTPVALRRDPRFCIAIPDPLDPLRTLAALEMLWDELTSCIYVYLWVREKQPDGSSLGRQYVAVQQNVPRPRMVSIPGVPVDAMRALNWWWPQLWFEPGALTMRPDLADVAADSRDGGPYCQTLAADIVPLFRFSNRGDTGEYEEHIDVLDRINRTILQRVVTQAIQAYKQRAMTQELPTSGPVTDRLPAVDPNTGEQIDWAEIFQPGPDALWKLPPGVKIWESTESDLKPMLAAAQDDIKTLAAATDTPMPLLSDDVNQSAEGAQFRREDLVFAVEDITELAGGSWAQVVACMFLFAPDSDRFVGNGSGNSRLDRADPAQIVIDWAPIERFSLQERGQADAQNKTLSVDMAAAKIWGLSPDEVAINREQRKTDIAELPSMYRLGELPPGIASNDPPPTPAPPSDGDEPPDGTAPVRVPA